MAASLIASTIYIAITSSDDWRFLAATLPIFVVVVGWTVWVGLTARVELSDSALRFVGLQNLWPLRVPIDDIDEIVDRVVHADLRGWDSYRAMMLGKLSIQPSLAAGRGLLLTRKPGGRTPWFRSVRRRIIFAVEDEEGFISALEARGVTVHKTASTIESS